MEKPRILIVSTAYIPLIGGAELAVKEITDRLGAQYNFDLVCAKVKSGLPGEEQIGNVSVFRVGNGGFFDKYLLAFRARRMAKKGGYDAVWVVMASYGAAFIPGAGVPYLLTLQEGDSEAHILRRVGIFYSLWKKIFKKTAYVQAISTYLKDFARRHGATAPVEVVPNGVDVEKFRQAPKLELQSPVTIVTTSRLVKKNGVDTLIEAAAQLRSVIPNTRYVIRIIGDGPERSNLQSTISRLQLEDTVELVGEVAFKEIPSELKKADIFARISRSEGLGSSFLEAMAAGLPIVGTPVGGIPDFLTDRETGLFARPDDPQDVAEKIKELIENDDLRAKVAQQGQERVLRDYTWDSVAERMNSIFEKVISTKFN